MELNQPQAPRGAGDASGWAVPGVEFARENAGRSPVSFRLRQVLEAFEADIAELADMAGADFTDDDGFALITAETELRHVLDQATAVRLAMLNRINESGAWKADLISVPKFGTWLAHHDDISRAAANAEVRTATKLGENLPETMRRYLIGEVSSEQVKVMCQVAATSEPRLTALAEPVLGWEPPGASAGGAVVPGINDDERDDEQAAGHDDEPNAVSDHEPDAGSECAASQTPTGEEHLLDLSAALTLFQFRRTATKFAHLVDPEADERGYRKAEEREYFQISETLGGYHLSGFLTEVHGQQLKIAIENLVDSELNANGKIRSELPRRNRPQRRASALADLAHIVMDHGLLGTGAIERRQIVINISWADIMNLCNQTAALTGGQGQLDINALASQSQEYAMFADGRGPIPRSLLRYLACDSKIQRIVFGPDSQVLDVGRNYRTVPPHIRTGVIARDKHCVYPGCDQPPARCEVHHAITHWADGG
ncbi:MAG: HNH endonuclease, partial [Promicromonosporaceae bacterium]|nr:HNH endonuclease [Promicromonosporaceae bacterium]